MHVPLEAACWQGPCGPVTGVEEDTGIQQHNSTTGVC